jgi:hypothetical protein
LAFDLDLQEIRDLYETKGEEIFDDSWVDDLIDVGKLVGADYSLRNLSRELRRILGETRLNELPRRVLITAFDLDNEDPDPARRSWKPKLFHNFPGEDSDGDLLAYRVGLYTSAAPTYFPSIDGFIDGGVYANNPSMCALAQSQDARIPSHPALSDVALLSLGTGTSLVYIKGDRHDWGYAQWAKPLISLMFDGMAGIAHFQCKQLLGERYHRLAPEFPPGVSIPMDGVDRIPDMISFAEALDLTDTLQWISDQWLV